MKKFLMLILFPLIVSAIDLQLLHEALVEAAQSDNQKRVVAAYLEKIEKIKQERIANLLETKKIARGGKVLYTKVFEKEIDRRIEEIK
jgi:ABC-type siderophore export system fused ATPase/permease subunit